MLDRPPGGTVTRLPAGRMGASSGPAERSEFIQCTP